METSIPVQIFHDTNSSQDKMHLPNLSGVPSGLVGFEVDCRSSDGRRPLRTYAIVLLTCQSSRPGLVHDLLAV